MAKITISFICTVLNEEKTVKKLLDSLEKQSVLPDEIIVVDGGSSDGTVAELKVQSSKLKVPLRILKRPGNRAVGRNEAIKQAKGEIILCSDSGCELDKNWVKEMTSSFKNVDVVSGYYKGVYTTIFQKCLTPYVLVMEDRIDENNFLPAARSMAFSKRIWEKVGGFPESFSHNEDYVFAKELRKQKAKIVFNKKALVLWTPPSSLHGAFIMFYRFAFGDMEAGIFRPKVLLIFTRYLLGVYIAAQSLLLASVLLFLYIVWAVKKNYKYVNNAGAYLYLPLFQFTSDFAVLIGSVLGLLRRSF